MRLDVSLYGGNIQKIIVEANIEQKDWEDSEIGDVIEFRVVEIHRTVVDK